MLFGCYSSDCLFSNFSFCLHFFSSIFRSQNFKIVRPQTRRFETKHVNLALFCSFSVPTVVWVIRKVSKFKFQGNLTGSIYLIRVRTYDHLFLPAGGCLSRKYLFQYNRL